MIWISSEECKRQEHPTLYQAAKLRYQKTKGAEPSEDQIQSEALPDEAAFLFKTFYDRHKDDPTDAAISAEFIRSFFGEYINTRINHPNDRVFRSTLFTQLSKYERFLFWGTDEYDHLREAAVNIQTTSSVTQTGESSETTGVTTEDKTISEKIGKDVYEDVKGGTTSDTEESTENRTGDVSEKSTGTSEDKTTTEKTGVDSYQDTKGGASKDTAQSTETKGGTVTERNQTDVTVTGDQTLTKTGGSTTTTNETTDQNTTGKTTEKTEGTTTNTETSSSLSVASDYPQSEATIPEGAGDSWVLKYASASQKGRETDNSTETVDNTVTRDVTEDITGSRDNTVKVVNDGEDTTTTNRTDSTDGTITTSNDLTNETNGTKNTTYSENDNSIRNVTENGSDTRTGKTDGTVTTTNNLTNETSGTKSGTYSENDNSTRNTTENCQETRTGKTDGTKSQTSNGSTETTTDSDSMSQLDRILAILRYFEKNRYAPIYKVIEELRVCFMAILPEEQDGYIDPETNILSKIMEA